MMLTANHRGKQCGQEKESRKPGKHGTAYEFSVRRIIDKIPHQRKKIIAGPVKHQSGRGTIKKNKKYCGYSI